jgi:NADPH:quinone reductase-like Zn-dependent oxidoreductase
VASFTYYTVKFPAKRQQTRAPNIKAIAFSPPQAIEQQDALIDIELPTPQAMDRDRLVKVHAILVNPVDTKIRASISPEQGQHKILGWHAAGDV